MLSAYSATNHLPIHLSAIVEPLSQEVTGNVGKALWLLFAAVLGLLLIACVNLASLQLARAIVRERDNAVRAALGAGGSPIPGSIDGKRRPLYHRRSSRHSAGIRWNSALCSHRPGKPSAPARDSFHLAGSAVRLRNFRNYRPDVRHASCSTIAPLQPSARIAVRIDARKFSFRPKLLRPQVLITFEIACTVVLLIVTGLVVRSFSRVLNQPHDFDASHVILAEVDLLSPRYEQPNDSATPPVPNSSTASRQIRSTPGVEFAAITSTMPLSGDLPCTASTALTIRCPESEVPTANLRNVSPGYFATMQTRLIAGRDFTASERSNPQSAIISQRAAQQPGPMARRLAANSSSMGTFTP